MNPWRPAFRWLCLLFVGSSAFGVWSCTPYASNRRRELHDGYPRGAGSFCALNPEGCPPSPTTKAPPGALT